MNGIVLKISIAGILFLLSVSTGIWLSKAGRPLKQGIFTLHKIISLLCIVFIVLIIYRLSSLIEKERTLYLLLAVSALPVILSLVSGGILSFEKPVNKAILWVHKVTPLLILISAVTSFHFLLNY